MRGKLAGTFILAVLITGCTPPISDGGTVQPTSEGLHLQTPDITLQPGQEIFKCYYTSLPGDAEVAVRRFQSQVEPMAKQMLTLQRQIKNLRRTRDLLLPRLISGQINVAKS